MKVYNPEFPIILTVVADEFINHPDNKDVNTCTVDWVEQELFWGRIQIVTNA